MKVIVTGGSGLLGRAVVAKAKAAGHEVKGLAFSRATEDLIKLDLHDSAAFEKLCEDFKPDVVIHAAAERRPDVAEKDPEAAKKLNVAVPQNIAKLCKRLDIVVIYISTDYVFPGEAPPAGYEPEDATEPLQLYGETKLAGEKEILAHGPVGKTVVLRVPVLYGPVHQNSESAINILVDVVQAQKRVKMDDWSTRYPTHVQDVARVLLDIGKLYSTNTEAKSLPSLVHFSSQSKVWTKLEISLFFAKQLGITDTSFLEPVKVGNQPGETRRPRDCHLSVRALKKIGIDCSEEQSFEEWFTKDLSK